MRNGWVFVRRAGALSLLLGVLLLLAPCAAGADGPQERQVIRVGFPNQPGFTFVDEQGNYAGYTYEYLREIAQYTGWEYEFVQLEGDLDQSLSQMLDMLARGELDLLGSMNYSSALAERYDYPGLSCGTANLALAVKRGNTTITESNLQLLDLLRIAVVEGEKTNIEQLDRFCRSNRIDYELVVCASAQEQLALLERDGADAVLWSDVSVAEELRVIAKFYPRAFFFATTKGNSEIVSKLNTAIMKIHQSDPYFSATLHQRYFGGRRDEVVLSDEEAAFVKRQEPLRVAFLTDKAPIQYIDGKTGEACGLARELFDSIAEKTGLEFIYVPFTAHQALSEAVRAGTVDLLAGLPCDSGAADFYDVALSRDYLTAQIVMAVSNRVDPGELAGKRLALPVGVSDSAADTADIVRYDSVEACIRAVNRNQADFAYGNGYTMQYYANLLHYKGITLIPLPQQTQKMAIGLAKPVDVALLTILNKSILSLSEGELQGMLYRSVGYVPPVTLANFVETNPTPVVLGVAALALVIIGGLLWNLHIHRAYSRRIARENARYETLCALSNEYLFEYDYTADRLNLSEQCAKLFRLERVQPHFYRDLGDREDKGALEGLLAEAQRGPVSHGHELSIKMPDGTMRRFRITMKITRDAEGRPLHNVGKLADIQEEWENRSRLEERAQRDSLTGLYNAAASREKAQGYLEQEPVGALLLLDIDYFKQINDKHGHYTGDQVLVAVADILKHSFRAADIIGRPGGDEFCVYMVGATERGPVEEKCHGILNDCAQLRGKAAGMRVSVSIGVVLAAGCRDYEALYRRADQALYAVKRKGRNDYCFAQDLDAPEPPADPEPPEQA